MIHRLFSLSPHHTFAHRSIPQLVSCLTIAFFLRLKGISIKAENCYYTWWIYVWIKAHCCRQFRKNLFEKIISLTRHFSALYMYLYMEYAETWTQCFGNRCRQYFISIMQFIWAFWLAFLSLRLVVVLVARNYASRSFSQWVLSIARDLLILSQALWLELSCNPANLL